MLAILSSHIPKKNYGYEFKWDGYRVLSFWDGKKLRFETRNQIDISEKLEVFQPLAKRLKKNAILDGEIVALNEKGQPSFDALQVLMGRMSGEKRRWDLRYMIFDFLFYGRQYLTHDIFKKRREQLQNLSLENEHIKISPLYLENPEDLLRAASENHLEGIMAKELTSLYYPGERCHCWKKIKIVHRQEFVIGGWLFGKGSIENSVGAILLGYYDQETGKLKYAGDVGSGFSDQNRALLKKYFQKASQKKNPFDEPVPNLGRVQFVKPIFAAEIEFRAWTAGGKIRQGVFKGIRQDKSPENIFREDQEKATQ